MDDAMPPRVAALTMSYNEPVYLPLWARHYARQVGADHCYVIDHGSTDATQLPPGMNLLRLPRSPHDDTRRAAFIAAIVAGFLQYYDWVIHSDVDELVMADPDYAGDLPSFCDRTPLETVTAIGFDLQQLPDDEAALVIEKPLGAQRNWVRFTSAMCKPVLTRTPRQWSPGFHSADTPLAFDRLYLFHLHWADYATGLQRLDKTRTMPWGDGESGAHQRITDAQWSALFNGMAALPRRDAVPFDLAQAPLSDWIRQTKHSAQGRDTEQYRLDLHINATELWAIPPRFRARL